MCSSLFSVFFALCIALTSHTGVVEHNFPSRGVNLYIEKSDISDSLEWDVQQMLDALTRAGLNSISISWPIYLDSATSSRPRSLVSSADINLLVDAASARGFRVLLHPLLDERNLMPKWRGTIEPDNIDLFFEEYKDLLLSYEADADAIIIGTELISLEDQYSHWENLVLSIREQNPSIQLIYSSNHFSTSVFDWSLVDVVGINFYPRNSPDLLDLRELKAELKAELPSDKSVILTEVGTTRQERSISNTGVWDHDRPQDESIQTRYYRNICTVFSDISIYWWSSTLFFNKDNLFEPFNSPTEEILDCNF